MSDVDEELLTGGGMTAVSRVGATVRRTAGPWTPTVHRLLERLAPLGLSPAPQGVDERGREVLSYLEGEVAHPPVPEHLRGDDVLVAVGRLVRRLHDASTDLVAETGWRRPALEPAEVVCHGDLAPYNVVFRDGAPVGLIDFDWARPGPRAWDLAYTAYALAPLSPEWGEPDEQWRRALLLFEAYGIPATNLADLVLERLSDMVRMIRELPEFEKQRAEGHDHLYLGHSGYVRRHFQDR
ncbi:MULTISPECIES: phosphotransferase [Actinosynnema]|uniref:phosphotransferase n=1 Tax=Actinosynnema TaxID=40566 RepID=UPI0020A57E9B|nr:aminoglycoside phosphotransferase family protein [Actinosynnema pretiosum]MCP2095328.1 Phosphotransferase enzyme family protein [Actinosynnema pretiosum]